MDTCDSIILIVQKEIKCVKKMYVIFLEPVLKAGESFSHLMTFFLSRTEVWK